MSQKVLVAIDISQPEDDAAVLQTAHRMAQMMDAELSIVSVVPSFGMSIVAGYFDEDFHVKAVAAAKKNLNAFVEEMLGAEVNAKTTQWVLSGRAYEKILEAAQKINPDLIVIGSHKPGFSDYLLGPNAARVVRHAAQSVYVVRH